MDVEHETVHYHGWSVALTDSQGIPDHVDVPSEQQDGIACMIHTALAKGQHTDPDTVTHKTESMFGTFGLFIEQL